METYFYIDRAGKACVTRCPGFVTESQKWSQKCVISEIKDSHLDCCFARKLFTSDGSIFKDFGKKARDLLGQ